MKVLPTLQGEIMLSRKRFWIAGLALSAAAAIPVWAITNGLPDAAEHPYVGQLLFYVPDELDSRFTTPGAWFNCSGTLLTPTIVLTAGHCADAIGLNGVETTSSGGDGGNDVWINFSEVPDYDGFPLSAGYIPNNNQQRYLDRAAWLDAHPDWVRATAYAHPEFNDGPFFLHDLGVLVLEQPVQVSGAKFSHGQLAPLGYLNQFLSSPKNEQRFTPVGYGLNKVLPKLAEGGDTREKASSILLSLKGVFGIPEGVSVKFSNNSGKKHSGGTCFGDSGGPVFDGATNVIVAVTSFGVSPNCTGTDGGYRIDQQDDLDFLASFGVTP
jgi:hypothetical protein